jgi:hypothetical protein
MISVQHVRERLRHVGLFCRAVVFTAKEFAVNRTAEGSLRAKTTFFLVLPLVIPPNPLRAREAQQVEAISAAKKQKN